MFLTLSRQGYLQANRVEPQPFARRPRPCRGDCPIKRSSPDVSTVVLCGTAAGASVAATVGDALQHCSFEHELGRDLSSMHHLRSVRLPAEEPVRWRYSP